jgi:hypothetical protein
MSDTLQPGDEIELVPGFDHLYNPDPLEGHLEGAYVGCRATIKDKREDEVGYPHIFVEWDKDDWRYHGMPDGWTYENHFRKVPKRITEKQDNSDLIIRDYVKRAQEQVAREDDRCQSCGEIHSERQVEFIEGLVGAEDKILRSDAYLIMTFTPTGDNTEVFQTAGALSEEMELEMEAEIIRLAAELILRRSQDGR